MEREIITKLEVLEELAREKGQPIHANRLRDAIESVQAMHRLLNQKNDRTPEERIMVLRETEAKYYTLNQELADQIRDSGGGEIEDTFPLEELGYFEGNNLSGPKPVHEDWARIMTGLNRSQRGQITRSIAAAYNGQIFTMGDLRSIPASDLVQLNGISMQTATFLLAAFQPKSPEPQE